jgi:hypothetical protein
MTGTHTLPLVGALATLFCAIVAQYCCSDGTSQAMSESHQQQHDGLQLGGECAQILLLLVEHSNRHFTVSCPSLYSQTVPLREGEPAANLIVTALRPGADGVVGDMHSRLLQLIGWGCRDVCNGETSAAAAAAAAAATAQCICLCISLLHSDSSYYANLEAQQGSHNTSCCCLSLRNESALQLVASLLQAPAHGQPQSPSLRAVTCLWLASSLRAQRITEVAADTQISAADTVPDLHLQLQNMVMQSAACTDGRRGWLSLGAVSCLEEMYSPVGPNAAVTATLVRGWAAHVARISRDLLVVKIARALQAAAVDCSSTSNAQAGSITAATSDCRAEDSQCAVSAVWSSSIASSSARSARQRAVAPAVGLAMDSDDATLARYLGAVFQRWPSFAKGLFEPLDGSHMLRYLTLLPYERTLPFIGLVNCLLANGLMPATDTQEAKAFLRQCEERTGQRERETENGQVMCIKDSQGERSLLVIGRTACERFGLPLEV